MPSRLPSRLYELVANPPPGSKIEAAVTYGVDLTLNLRRLQLTPAERIEDMQAVLRFMEALQHAERADR